MARRKRTEPVPPQPPKAEPVAASAASGMWEHFQAIREGATQLHLGLLTAFSTLQPIAVGWFDDAGALPTEPWQFYAAVFKRTAPLTIGLIIWVCLLVAWSSEATDEGGIGWMALLGGLILTVSAQVGNALGAPRVDIPSYFQALGPINALANALLGYLQAYRGTLFFSSVAISVYAGYLCHRVLRYSRPVRPASTASSATAADSEVDSDTGDHSDSTDQREAA